MADQSPSPNSSLVSQLQTTLAQLEQVVQQLEADPQQRQSLPAETLTRLQSTLTSLRKMGAPGRSPTVSPPPRSPRRPKPKFGMLTAIATGLLGILVGILLWIGIPPLNLPPLWDQIASRIPPLPTSPAPDQDLIPPNLSPDRLVETPETDAELPPILEAPAPPTAIALEPLPEAPLTPEQSLLAVIQRELIDLEGLYPPQLIQRIQPDFLASRLTLTIGDNWNQLSAKQQQTLLDTLWQRAQKLSFQQLRLYAPNGDLIARSPVVGPDMVVLQASDTLTE